MRRIGLLAGQMSGMALAVAAAAAMPTVADPNPRYYSRVERKPKRTRKPADRSKKQYLLKGIRP